MAVISNNSSSTPMTYDRVYYAVPVPNIIKPGSNPSARNTGLNSSPGPDPNIQAPSQVIGLVPLFDCCQVIDAVGGFRFGNFDALACSGVIQADLITLEIILGGNNLGTFSFTGFQNNAFIQSQIQALLPSGWTCVVTGSWNNRTCVLTAPTGSGSAGNLSLTVNKTGGNCGGVIATKTPSGGTDANECDPNCDCREGKYKADFIPDDRDFPLAVFADLSCTDTYKNDYNGWLLQYPFGADPITSGDFKLQKMVSGTWTSIATLNTNLYGTPYSYSCTNINYFGFVIQWYYVLQAFGEGNYRLYISGVSNQQNYCKRTPPFCLKQWDCWLSDGTVKFETEYTGGNFGSVTDQGTSWNFCCELQDTVTAINWIDSIRFYGFFGYETADMQKDQLKYSSGEIKKIRDEAIKMFTLKSDKLPIWFHQRFYAYALMADRFFVSDYNLNNASYSYKHFWIVGDSSYAPKYTNYSRYTRIQDVKFKEGDQFVFRDRCCSGNKPINVIHLPTPIPQPANTYRQWSDLTQHHWSDNTPADWA